MTPHQARQHIASVTLLLACAVSLARPAVAQSVTPVPKLDLSQIVGTWYEISRIPNSPEKKCTRDGLVLYSFADKRNAFQMVTSCHVKDGYPDSWNAKGKLPKAGDGRLKLSYIFPFWRKYWVLANGPGYEWLLIGSPNHKSLWILARTTGLPPDVLADIQSRATAQGFNAARLVPMPQHN